MGRGQGFLGSVLSSFCDPFSAPKLAFGPKGFNGFLGVGGARQLPIPRGVPHHTAHGDMFDPSQRPRLLGPIAVPYGVHSPSAPAQFAAQVPRGKHSHLAQEDEYMSGSFVFGGGEAPKLMGKRQNKAFG